MYDCGVGLGGGRGRTMGDAFCELELVLAGAGPAGAPGKARFGGRVPPPQFPLFTFVSFFIDF